MSAIIGQVSFLELAIKHKVRGIAVISNPLLMRQLKMGEAFTVVGTLA